MNWRKDLKSKVKLAEPLKNKWSYSLNEPLKNKTTFKIGGKAKYFCEPKSIAELSSLIVCAKKHKVGVCILGAGSNLLVSDKGVDALVVKLNAPFFKKITFHNHKAVAGSGAMLAQLLQMASTRGLSGLEFLAGIPATVGGALAMNSGAWGKAIAKNVEEAQVMDNNGKIKTLKKKDIRSSYRKSSLAKYIILSARFKLEKKNRNAVRRLLRAYLKIKREKQDYSHPNAGCVFKNPKGRSAGWLIDSCGLKGKSIGGAYISNKHANFIINKGYASSEDVVRLIKLVKERVKNKFNIGLEPEVKIWK